MSPQSDDNPLEQLVELLVYAPIGMLYEYPDVLPRLIKKGRSQVQLAKFAGQLAMRQQQQKSRESSGNGTGSSTPSVSPDILVEGIARLITEIGSMVGLAPPHGQSSSPAEPSPPTEHSQPPSAAPATEQPEKGGHANESPATSVPPRHTAKLPIANYDKLTAKEVIFLLDDLTVSQLKRVHRYEQEHRNRKTVLTKIDRLLT
jgi:hypothetical protein